MIGASTIEVISTLCPTIVDVIFSFHDVDLRYSSDSNFVNRITPQDGVEDEWTWMFLFTNYVFVSLVFQCSPWQHSTVDDCCTCSSSFFFRSFSYQLSRWNESWIHEFVILFFHCCNGIGGIPSTKWRIKMLLGGYIFFQEYLIPHQNVTCGMHFFGKIWFCLNLGSDWPKKMHVFTCNTCKEDIFCNLKRLKT